MAARRSPDGAARRAATTTTGSGSTRTIPNIILLCRRSGRDRHGERRRDVELLVQPADGAVLPREHGQRVSVPRLRRPAGKRIGVRVEPRRRWARSRCASGRRSAPRSTATSRPIPSDPDIVYGGKLTRFDRRTGQTQDVTPPRGPNYRVLRTAPVLFSPHRARPLFFASNTLWKTTNGGQNWTEISPDLSRETWEVPATVGVYRGSPAAQPTRRGVIYTIAPSTIDQRDHLGRHRRRPDSPDARRRHDVERTSRPRRWARGRRSRCSRRRTSTPTSAYAAINTLRLDDLRPHILRTRDGGQTWVEITNGLPPGGVDQRRPRGSVAARPALRGQRARRVRVVRRRRELAVAAAEHAGDVGSRSRHQGRGSHCRHARARLLDPRRHHAAAPDHAGHRQGAGVSVPAGAGVALPLEQEHGHAAAARRAGRRRIRRTASRSRISSDQASPARSRSTSSKP